MSTIIKKINQLEKLKQQSLLYLENLTNEQINYQFKEGEWSLVQVINHFIDTESGTGKYMSYKLKKEEKLEGTGIKNFLRSKGLNSVLKSSKKFKIPKVLNQPANKSTVTELNKNWNENREKLISLIHSIPKNDQNKAIFKHPIVGYLNLNQTLDFLINHLIHHQMQLKKIKKNL